MSVHAKSVGEGPTRCVKHSGRFIAWARLEFGRAAFGLTAGFC